MNEEQEHTEQETEPKPKLTKQQRIRGLTIIIAIITAVLLLAVGFSIVMRIWIN